METNDTKERMQRILMRWIRYANEEFDDWHQVANCGYFFGGAYWYGIETALTSAVYAAIGVSDHYDEELTGVAQSIVVERAIKALRYICLTHHSGPTDAVRVQGINLYNSGTKWGGEGEVFFRASQTGVSIAAIAIAATLLWKQLDEETRELVQTVTVYYANKWSVEEPRNGVYMDTQCEENGWTSAGISAAIHLFPEHPNYELWKKAALKWAVNAVSVDTDWYRDRKTITTATFHPDFTAENHAFVHPTYMMAGIMLRANYAVLSLLTGQRIPPEITRYNEDVYEQTLKPWSDMDGIPIPLQGQDWWYNRQPEALHCHAIMHIIHRDPDAARLELQSLRTIEQIQQSNSRGCLLEENGEQCIVDSEGFQTAREMEFTSAYAVMVAYLLHQYGDSQVEPTDEQQLEQQLAGLYYYPYGCSIFHRTAKAFTSFSWRNHVMAISMPAKAVWDITPLYASYTGEVTFDEGYGGVLNNEQFIVDTESEQIIRYADGFGAIATVIRGKEQAMTQSIGFISLPDGRSVYMERLALHSPAVIQSIKTGMIGIRNEHYTELPDRAIGQKTLFLPSDTRTYKGFYGKQLDEQEQFAPVPYLNVNDNMGYVLFGSAGITYINRHQYPKWKGVEDILILNDAQQIALADNSNPLPFCIINLPNYNAVQTAEAAGKSYLLEHDCSEVIIVETDQYLAFTNFARAEQSVEASRPITATAVTLFAGYHQITSSTVKWCGSLPAYQSGYIKRKLLLTWEEQQRIELEVVVLPGKVVLENKGQQSLQVKLFDDSSHEQQLWLEPSQIKTWTYKEE